MPEIRSIKQISPEDVHAIRTETETEKPIRVHTNDVLPERVIPRPIHVISVSDNVVRPIKIDTSSIIYDGDLYEGPYVVTPKVSSQQLATAHKLMDKDVTVLEIPYFETSNQNGITVYIADEL